jgi:integrase
MITKHGRIYSDFYRSDGKRVRKPLGLPAGAPVADAKRAEAALMVAEEAAIRGSGMANAPAAHQPGGEARGAETLKQAFRRAKVEREKWRTSKSPRTLDSTLASILLDLGEDVLVSSLTSDRLRSYRATLLAKGLAPNTINSRLSFIKVCLGTLAEDLGEDVAVPVVKRIKSRPGRKRFYSDAECAKLVAACYTIDTLLGQATELALETALRRAEVTRIEARDVIMPEGLRPRLMVWDAKADNPSPVPLTATAERILLDRIVAVGGSGRLFPVHPDSLTKGFKQAAVACGLSDDPQAVFHALRHTVATRILERTGDIRAAQAFLRHKSISTTMGYAHLAGRSVDAIAGALEGAQTGTANRAPASETIGAAVGASTVNPQVPGSSPGRGAKTINDLGDNPKTDSPDGAQDGA